VFNPDLFPTTNKQIEVDEPIKELVEFTSGLDNSKGDNVLFPCTPMGVCQIIMSMGTFWNHHVNKEDALKGKVITIYNRYVFPVLLILLVPVLHQQSILAGPVPSRLEPD